MALLPWMLVLLMATAPSHQKDSRKITQNTRHRLDQIEVDYQDCQSEDGVKTVLNGTAVGEWRFYKWQQKTEFDGVNFEHDDEMIVNVTVPRSTNRVDRTFTFRLTANNRHKDISRRIHPKATALASVLFKDRSSEGVRLFATEVVYSLLQLHYDYIVLAYQHRKASCHHPNVADYFRSYAKERAVLLDRVVGFVHEKQATEFAASGCPTDYVSMMEKDGFKTTVHIHNVTDDVMISTFKSAYEYETNLGRLLANVWHHAEQTKEVELSEFVAADLLPQVTKAINSHKNVIETVLYGTENAPDRFLKEFLFDKYITK